MHGGPVPLDLSRVVSPARSEGSNPSPFRAVSAYQLAQDQADDPGLWFIPMTASEDYLQQALRHLHAAVERDAAVFDRIVSILPPE